MSRLLGLLLLLAVLGTVGYVVATRVEPHNTANDASIDDVVRPTLVSAPPVLADSAPPLRDLDGWLQADFDELSDLEGRVVIVQFWTFGCINCKRTLANLAALYEDYSATGLEIVGVHAPEFEYERDAASIAAAAVELGVTWPIALDTNKVNFGTWQGSKRYWPRTYVIDRSGQVRFDHIGEGKYDELRATVEYLLGESV